MFSQTTEYALRATTWLALTPGRLVSTGELAEHTGVPMHYLAKVLQQLASGGLVTGRRGVGGGYKLAREPNQIRLIDVVRCVSPLRRDGTRTGAGPESDSLRALEDVMDQIAADVIEVLDDKRLSDIVVPSSRDTDAAAARQGRTEARTNGQLTARA